MPFYYVKQIGLLPGGTYSIANAMNNKGEVAGCADTPVFLDKEYLDEHAVFFSFQTGLKSINTPAQNSSDFGLGYGINDLSQVVGYIEEDYFGPFLWSAATGVWILGPGGYCTALEINNHGVIVGSQAQGFDPDAACVWDGPRQRFRLLEPWAGPATSEATGINDHGVIVGWKQPVGRDPWAFIVYPGGGLNPIGPFEDPGSKAYRIGSGGYVVGETINGGVTRAYLWTAEDGATYLDTLGGVSSWATAVNTTGSVVGSVVMPGGDQRAFLYENGVMTDLNTFLPAGSPWQLRDAVAINDHGQIAGNGFHAGTQMGYILSPLLLTYVQGEVLELITHIIRNEPAMPWPFSWPFPGPDPGPWKEVFPQGSDPMILAAMSSLVSQLSDDKLRHRLSEVVIPMLQKALERLQNDK